MSFTIEPVSLITFLDNNKFKLPRFQRKATWDKKQNFELCISIFQDYPIGVVIVNKEQNVSWLLDGRQRRNALMAMRDNPVELYEWARNYLGFGKRDDELELQDVYWGKVEKYLQSEVKTPDETHDNDYEGEETDIDEDSFDSVKQRQGLQTLLDIIRMVHQNKPGGSKWELTFDFRKFFPRLRYAPIKNNSKIDPVLLRRFILEIIKDADHTDDGKVTEDSFVDYYLQNFITRNEASDEDDFRNEVHKRWPQIAFSIDVINRSEKIFTDVRIGIIWLKNASPLDAQNIFSRINKGGTQLKAEELLSAKPYWNREVNTKDQEILMLAKEMYSCLDIPMANEIVRWDVAATLLDRIKDGGLIFDSYDKERKNGEVSMDKITLGFKLLSSIYTGGMSNKHVLALEKKDDIDWDNGLDNLVSELNIVSSILQNDSFFACFQCWKQPIAKLLGNAIALEFITIMWLDWIQRGKPQYSISGEMKALQRDGRILFDRLVFEYATKTWRGSGDSKMSTDIKSWASRLDPVDEPDWKAFIDSASKGVFNGQPTTVKLLRPVLYYYYALTHCTPLNHADVVFDVDHIIPQEAFEDNPMVASTSKDCLSNLALLPSKANNSKRARRLNGLSKEEDPWLRKQIVVYTGISEDKFDYYSDISHIGDLQSLRGELYSTAFSANRQTVLSN